MGSMIDDEYASRFLEFLRYLLYLKDEKEKNQLFIGEFPLPFRDRIEFEEPLSLEEYIKKLKHCYEESKHKPLFKYV